MNSFRVTQNCSAFIGQAVPWLAASTLPYPRPFCVRNHAIVGTREPGSQAASSTVWVTGPHSMPCSVPSTRQPYGANQSSGVPATTLEAGRGSMPKSFQSTMKIRLSRPRPHALFFVSCAEPGVSPPSPSNTKTLTWPAPASFRASASPAAGGIPCPDGPVLNFRNSVRPSISACPGRPPFRRRRSSHSQVSAQRPSSGKANSGAPVRSKRARTASLSTPSVAYTKGTV